MKYLQEIIKKNKIWIIIYIILGIGLSFLANYSVSYFQKLIVPFYGRDAYPVRHSFLLRAPPDSLHRKLSG